MLLCDDDKGVRDFFGTCTTALCGALGRALGVMVVFAAGFDPVSFVALGRRKSKTFLGTDWNCKIVRTEYRGYLGRGLIFAYRDALGYSNDRVALENIDITDIFRSVRRLHFDVSMIRILR